MKKILSFLFLFLMPFVVKAADIEIKSMELIEKSDGVTIIEEPTFNNEDINFNMSFTLPEDFAKYKLVIKNTSKEDYILEEKETFSKGEYIKYTISYKDNAKSLKAGKEVEATLVITYDKEIPVEAFNDEGKYIEENTYALLISNLETNPYTKGAFSYILVAVLIISLGATIYFARKQKYLAMFILAISVIGIPLVVNGLRKVSLNINTKIRIDDRPYILDTEYGSFSESEDIKQIEVKFDNNKYQLQYEFAPIQWGQQQESTNILVLNVFKDHFTKNSYVKVYDSENDKLLIEVTLDTFPRPLYQVTNGFFLDFSRIEKPLEGYSKDRVRVELSEDLQPYLTNNSSEVYYMMYTTSMSKQTYKAPWISDQATLEKIQALQDCSNENTTLKGFVVDKKNSHVYHAIWGEPDIIK